MSGIVGDNTDEGSGQIAAVQGITTSSSDPALDTNPSDGVGAMFVNITSGEMYICTDATAGSNIWTNAGAGEGSIPKISPWGARGVFGGGLPSEDIEYVTIATIGNTTEFGELTVGRSYFGSASSGVRGVFAGGGPATTEIIDYITISTPGNAYDFGDLTSGRTVAGNVNGWSSGTRGVFGGGGSTSGYQNVIDYITIDTLGNATDFGNLTQSRYGAGAYGSLVRCVWAGGYYGSAQNTMDYITIATIGDAQDFGDMNWSGSHTKGCSSEAGRGLIAGGYPSYNTNIDYVAIDTIGNGTDFGDLTQGRFEPGSTSSGTRGLWVGGYSGSQSDVIDYVTIATIGGNALDFGDLETAGAGAACVAGG